MSQVFLSYGREDKAVAHRVAEQLDRIGYSVWWDPEIKVGAAYSRAITAALAEAECVIVLWSEHSIDSDWVQAEADRGWKRGILVPAMIQPVEPPLPFGRLETIDLVAWTDDAEAGGFERLASSVAVFSAPLDPVSRWVHAVSAPAEAELLALGPQPSWVADVALAGADGAVAVTAGGDGVLRSWNASTGAAGSVANGHQGPIWCCAARADLVVSGGSDRLVRLWRGPELAPETEFAGHDGWVLGCAISPDGSKVASASRDQTVRLWDVAAGTERASLAGHAGPVWSCAYSPDGRLLVTTSDDQTVRVWSTRERAAVHVMRGHHAPVMAAVVAPDGDLAYTGGYDGVVRAWSMESGSAAFELAGGEGWILSLAISPDGAMLATGRQEGTIGVWNLRERRLVTERHAHTGPVMGLDFVPDVGLLSGAADKSASILRRRPVRVGK